MKTKSSIFTGVRTKIKRLGTEQKGASSVLFALGIVAFMGFLALVTDVGVLYVEQLRLSNAVDAAALAGAQQLPDFPDKAVLDAESYAVTNGAPTGSIVATVDETQKEMTVESAKTAELYFARVIGFNTGNIKVKAKAKLGPVKAVRGVAPLAVEKMDFEYGAEYVLKDGSGHNYDQDGDGTDDTDDPDDDNDGILDEDERDDRGGRYGWFGPLSLGGEGAARYEENLKNGYEGLLQLGTQVETETGNISGPTKRAIDYRINKCNHYPACTVDSYELDCPEILYIPVIEPVPHRGNQTKEVTVVGFAAFLVQEASGQGHNSEVRGYFIKTVSNGDLDLDGTDYGLYGVKLVQ